MGSSFYFVGWSLGFIIGILAEDYKALQDGCYGKILLCCQLSPLSVSQQYRRRVGLETCDGLGLAGLAHDIHSLSPNQDRCLKKKPKELSPPFFQLKEAVMKSPVRLEQTRAGVAAPRQRSRAYVAAWLPPGRTECSEISPELL